jgi:hypothetical protein
MEALLCLHEADLLTRRDVDDRSRTWGVSCTRFVRNNPLAAPKLPSRLALPAPSRPPLAARCFSPGHASAKKNSTEDKKWSKDKVPGAEEDAKLKKSKGRSLELNETLATIAHLYAGNERSSETGLRSEKINKKDFYRIFGDVIWMRQQLEVIDQCSTRSSPRGRAHLRAPCLAVHGPRQDRGVPDPLATHNGPTHALHSFCTVGVAAYARPCLMILSCTQGNRTKNFTKFQLREMTDDMFDVGTPLVFCMCAVTFLTWEELHVASGAKKTPESVLERVASWCSK